MAENGLSTSDILALKDNDGFGGENGVIWFLLIIFILGGFGGGFGVGNGNYVTQAEFNAGLNNQTTQNSLQQLLLSSANNNYETAQLINNQTNQMIQQQNANMVNAIQAFNSVNQSLERISAQMEQCCCSIKTQMLQDRYEDARAENVALKGAISNANQTQDLLSTMGRWVGWASEGSQASTGT